MTAPWSGSEEADGDEELAEGVGSADAVASAVGDAEGAAALGVVAAGLGALLTVACWRDRAVAAAHPRAGTITRMARKGQTFFHLDGLGRCMPTGISSPARSNSSLGYEELTSSDYRKRAGLARVARGKCVAPCAVLVWCYE